MMKGQSRERGEGRTELKRNEREKNRVRRGKMVRKGKKNEQKTKDGRDVGCICAISPCEQVEENICCNLHLNRLYDWYLMEFTT